MKERMHIAHFTNTYKPNVNGVVRSVSSFRDAFTRLGHNVFIFAQETRDYEDTEPFVFRYPAVKIPTVDYSAVLPVSHSINSVLPILKLDVIHSNHPTLLGDVAVTKAKDLNLPLVFTFHTMYHEYTHYFLGMDNELVKQIVRKSVRYLKQCNHIVTPTESIRQMLLDFGVRGPVTAVPTGIDLRPYQEADGQAIRNKYGWGRDKVLVSIGRMAPEKNWTTLLDAMAQVCKQRRDVRLVLIGSGPQAKELEEYAAKLGIGDRVQFTGLVPMDAVPAYLKAADLFVFASISETQGLVTMEAMSAGLPVVAVDATGTSDEVTDGEQGLLTENDSAALARAILKVLDDPALYAHLQEGAARKARSFDIMAKARQMLDVYAQAIEDKKANRTIEVDEA